MTAVEHHGTPHSFMAERQPESPTARFTAVNGRDSISGSVTPNNTASNGHPRRESEDRSHAQPRISPPGQEKLTITTSSAQREERTPNGSTVHSTYAQGSSYPDSDGSHKRKRSGSHDGPSSTSSGHYYHSYGVPKSAQGDSPEKASTAAFPTPNGPESYTSSQGPVYSYPSKTPDHDRSSLLETPTDQTQSSHTEDQLREALTRENQGSDGQSSHTRASPGEEDSSFQSPYGDNRTPIQREDERKKRKRNFSNRTKTGCMTCRKRKKKCDETRPECNNCLRGGFVCNGYPSRGQWPKTEPKQPPVPLQSKDGGGYDPNHYAPSPFSQPQPAQQPKREPLPAYRGQQGLRVDPQQPPRSHGIDDDRLSASTMPSASANSPDTRLSAVSYSQNSPFPTPVSANPNAYDRVSHDFKRMPPLLDPGRQEYEANTPQSATLPHISILNPPHSEPHNLSQATTNAQDAARLALSHPASNPTRMRTQKEHMLLGTHYYPFDRELVLERERCNAACWRFNSSTNPNNGVSPEERHRQFRDILQPQIGINMSPTEKSAMSPAGRLGGNVVVEAPFTCDYGYNIHIGTDVAIGKNCTILDTCEVKIGDRCIIGPNVNIYTATLPVDPKRRLGSRGPHLGQPIVIEEDCWIGGGVTILPGRRIGKGSTVGAGSIVTRDVPQYTVACGNPARVIRGIYPGPHE